MTAWLSHEEWIAIRLSLQVSLAAVLVSLPLGIALGWLLARRTFPGKAWVETFINLPLVLPPVVTGYAILVLLGRNGWLGSYLEDWLGIRFVFDWKGAVVASAVVAFPLMVRSIRLAMSAVDLKLEHTARSLGAGPWAVFCTVTLPLAREGVIAGVVLAFARAMGEFCATLMIAGNIPGQTCTIPLYIYNTLESPDGMAGCGGVLIAAVLISAGALFAGEYLERRGKRRLQAGGAL